MTEWLLVGLGVLLTIGTALFVAGEFSLVSVDRSAVERAVEAGDRRAQGVLRRGPRPLHPAVRRPGRASR